MPCRRPRGLFEELARLTPRCVSSPAGVARRKQRTQPPGRWGRGPFGDRVIASCYRVSGGGRRRGRKGSEGSCCVACGGSCGTCGGLSKVYGLMRKAVRMLLVVVRRLVALSGVGVTTEATSGSTLRVRVQRHMRTQTDSTTYLPVPQVSRGSV